MLPITLLAQLTTYPLEGNQTSKSNNRSAKVNALNPVIYLELPFWDDFSVGFKEEGSSLDFLWIRNDKVTVSSGQAIHPPSINVATFDGLNELGIPYSPSSTDVLDFGYRDTLESQPIKLQSEVVLANRDSVFLSFSYQAGGHAEPPDPNDFLRLEFKKADETWKEVVSLRKIHAPDRTAFYDTLIQIKDALYYHDDFRFRFISFGRKSARLDAWHIDYVYLNQHRTKNDNAFPDRTLSTPLGTIFGKYYAVPIKHFFKKPEINTTSFFVRNLYKDSTVLQYNTRLKSIKNYGGPPISDSVNLDIRKSLFDSSGTIPSLDIREVFIKTLPDTSMSTIFDPAAIRIDLIMTLFLDSADNRPPPKTDFSPFIYDSINFRSNDTLSVNYFLDSTYAYDDGVAEYSAGLVNAGERLAYRFDNIHAGQDSILNGVDIYFPVFAGVTNSSSMEFFVLDDNNGEPGNVLYEDIIDISLTTMNQFTKINFYQGVIVDDVFYIGYREPSGDGVRIGLDKSNDSSDKMYYKLTETGSWQINTIFPGSLMMRPCFGPSDVVTGISEEIQPVSIYPNPSRGDFYVKGVFEQLRVISITGQPIPASIEDLGDMKRISVATASSGIYIVQYKSGSKLFTEKILISK